MYCKECRHKFYYKRNFLSLLKEQEEFLCNTCYSKHPINLKEEEVLLDRYYARILSMFNMNYNIDYNVYIKEYTKIYEYLSYKKGYVVLFYDKVYLNDDFIESIDVISKLFKSNLYILCFSMRS